MITIIIPAYNAEATILNAVESCLKSECIAKVIVVADAPTDKTVELLTGVSYNPDIVEIIELEDNVGAGACRNMGIEKVITSHIAFLDADDTINAYSFDTVFNDMASGCDLAVGCYKYCKCEHQLDASEMTLGDERVISSILQSQDKIVLEADLISKLLLLVNYPWNKIYRTDFIRKYGIKFQTIPVHNDILFHWSCLIQASRVLLHRAIMVNHFVFDNRNQMTNDTSERRLSVFSALHAVKEIALNSKRETSAYFYQFLEVILPWTLRQIDIQHRDKFVERLQMLLMDYTIREFNQVYEEQPIVACNMMILKNTPSKITHPNFKL